MNCGFESRIDDVEAVLELGSNLDLMGKIAERVGEFLERVEVWEMYEQQGTVQRRGKEEEELKWIIWQKETVSSPLDSKICVSYLSETLYYY